MNKNSSALLTALLSLAMVGCERPTASGGDPDAGAIEDAAVAGADSGMLPAAPEGCALAGGFPVPAGADPWSGLNGLKDQALRDALYQRIKDHTALTYNDARRAMLSPDGGIDVHGGKIECVYTGRLVDAVGATSNGINVEHSWPQNEGAQTLPAESDLHHLFPADSEANLRRGSLPFTFTDCDQTASCLWSLAGSKIGPITGGSLRVFEDRPETRGDLARAHFYFAVRYQMSIDAYEEQALRCWNWADPPDALERARNDAIEAIQHNRNPFVDRPDLVQAIADF